MAVISALPGIRPMATVAESRVALYNYLKANPKNIPTFNDAIVGTSETRLLATLKAAFDRGVVVYDKDKKAVIFKPGTEQERNFYPVPGTWDDETQKKFTAYIGKNPSILEFIQTAVDSE